MRCDAMRCDAMRRDATGFSRLGASGSTWQDGELALLSSLSTVPVHPFSLRCDRPTGTHGLQQHVRRSDGIWRAFYFLLVLNLVSYGSRHYRLRTRLFESFCEPACQFGKISPRAQLASSPSINEQFSLYSPVFDCQRNGALHLLHFL